VPYNIQSAMPSLIGQNVAAQALQFGLRRPRWSEFTPAINSANFSNIGLPSQTLRHKHRCQPDGHDEHVHPERMARQQRNGAGRQLVLYAHVLGNRQVISKLLS
jgi:hypothetical protein